MTSVFPTATVWNIYRLKTGDYVESGAVLGYLNTHAEYLAQKEYIESLLHEAREKLRVEIASGEDNIARANLEIEKLQKIPPYQIQAVQAELDAYQIKLSQSKMSWPALDL